MFFGVVSSPLDLGLEDPNKQPTVFVETQGNAETENFWLELLKENFLKGIYIAVNYGATDQRLQEEENSSENETNDKQTLVDAKLKSSKSFKGR